MFRQQLVPAVRKGMWLDQGEWKVLAERERGGFFGRWFLGDRDA